MGPVQGGIATARDSESPSSKQVDIYAFKTNFN